MVLRALKTGEAARHSVFEQHNAGRLQIRDRTLALAHLKRNHHQASLGVKRRQCRLSRRLLSEAQACCQQGNSKVTRFPLRCHQFSEGF